MNQQERDAKIEKWVTLSKWIEKAKIEEMQLRNELAEFVLGNVEPISISKKVHLGNGYGLEATQNINYKLDEFDRIQSVTIWLYNNGCEAKQLFKPGYTFSESKYKQLEPKFKMAVDEVISYKIGTPKLTFIQPE